MTEPITREEFNTSIGRIHEEVKGLTKTSIQIETSTKQIKESVDKMFTCVFGNGQDGLTGKITKLFERVSLHTKLVMLIIGSIIGLAFCLFRAHI